MNIGTLIATLGLDTTQLDTATTHMNSVSQKFRTFGYLASAALTVPIVAAAKATVQLAEEYEYTMQKIVGLTGVAQSAVNSWSDDILKLGPQLGKTPQELAEALYFVSSSGIKGAEAMKVLELSAKAASAGLGETQKVADLLTSALNAYRGTGLTASYATDVLVAAVREGKAEASGFSTAMGQIIPIASQLGVSFDQVAGGMAAITLTGSSSANAAVYLKGVFNSLLTASSQGEKALNSVGTSYKQLRDILGQQGIIPLMQKLRDIQMKYGDELISDVLPNIRALTGYLSLSGKNFQYNADLMDRVSASAGSLNNAWSAVADTIKIRFDSAMSSAKVSMITLGKSIAEVLIPVFEKLVKKLEQLANWFTTLSEGQKQMILTITAIVAALGPLSLAISVLGYAFSGLISILTKVDMMFATLRLAVIANPYVAIGAAIIAIAGGLIHFINKTKEAATAQNAFNSALINVNGNIKKLKDLTNIDYAGMNFMTLEGVKKEALVQKATAFKLIQDAVARAGKTMDEFYSGAKMGKYGQYIDIQVQAWNSANAVVKEVDKSLDSLADSFTKQAVATKANSNIVVSTSIEQIEALNRLEQSWLDIRAAAQKYKVQEFMNLHTGNGSGPMKQLITPTLNTPSYGFMPDVVNTIVEQTDAMNESLTKTRTLASELTQTFTTMFMSVGKGWQDVFESIVSGLRRLIAEILAKMVVFGILSLISGGTSNLALGAGKLIEGGMGNFLLKSLGRGFAGGTTNAPGGLALVGERGPELVNLPRGSQVFPNHLLGAASSSGKERLIAEVGAESIRFILMRDGTYRASFS